jgi:hypothetical protein
VHGYLAGTGVHLSLLSVVVCVIFHYFDKNMCEPLSIW